MLCLSKAICHVYVYIFIYIWMDTGCTHCPQLSCNIMYIIIYLYYIYIYVKYYTLL